MHKYRELKHISSINYKKEKKTYNIVSIIRLIIILGCGYFIFLFYKTNAWIYLVLFSVSLVLFFASLIVHGKVALKKKIAKNLILINKNEIDFLNNGALPFDNGYQYINSQHLHSYDLDFFGDNSIFQYLNRTKTYIGSKILAELLKSSLTKNEIESNQEAIKELSPRVEWRQKLAVFCEISQDNKENYLSLIKWAKKEDNDVSKFTLITSYVSPILFIIIAITSYFTNNTNLVSVLVTIFFINLLITLLYLKKIKKQIVGSDKISDVLKSYSYIIEAIEKEEFNSIKLNDLKAKLNYNKILTSNHIKKLGSLFSNLQNIQNVTGAILINGLGLYHINVLNSILKWKKTHKNHVDAWLDTIGEFEALNSIANFSYNNKSFVYPKINNDSILEFKDLGHPLLAKEKRVCNTISFFNNNMVILTGSNMAGKSTFLRTLGVNMVLGSIGSPICATDANINPLRVIVSMRQKDSLNDNESYFFAEIKRIKQIMDEVEKNNCFVLLDEILRGTNSEDKQQGTIKIIEKLISKNAVGVIATHDLKVCDTSKKHPNNLVNKCFEVEIKNNDLEFDYKLRNGVCKNKSATFLMKKLNVIE
ncbi:DNA mismatch repair protein [Aquimarina sp. RZ0]|uniref:MutS-related protein n=1 Tax=Aquimarina sp. RZ0 TaxID=2607730 RepID=UPI0011F3B146|nr:DNA mismatch repair protein [Aquimarina sp. RZ0]KAA1244683.1 DNA mismatch repair protein [Aquimarina sp. RZ0]